MIAKLTLAMHSIRVYSLSKKYPNFVIRISTYQNMLHINLIYVQLIF